MLPAWYIAKTDVGVFLDETNATRKIVVDSNFASQEHIKSASMSTNGMRQDFADAATPDTSRYLCYLVGSACLDRPSLDLFKTAVSVFPGLI